MTSISFRTKMLRGSCWQVPADGSHVKIIREPKVHLGPFRSGLIRTRHSYAPSKSGGKSPVWGRLSCLMPCEDWFDVATVLFCMFWSTTRSAALLEGLSILEKIPMIWISDLHFVSHASIRHLVKYSGIFNLAEYPFADVRSEAEFVNAMGAETVTVHIDNTCPSLVFQPHSRQGYLLRLVMGYYKVNRQAATFFSFLATMCDGLLHSTSWAFGTKDEDFCIWKSLWCCFRPYLFQFAGCREH